MTKFLQFQMKKKHLLFPLALGFAYVVLSSFANGIAGTGPSNDYTGAVSSTTCASCHGGSSTTTTASFTLTDKATNQVVTDGKYTPGNTYVVTFKGVNSGTLAKFGFQAMALTSTNANAGTITATNAATAIRTMNSSRKLIEQTSILTGTASNLSVDFDWTAPAAGTGAVTFHGVVNAVNGANGDNGDKCSPHTTATFAELATGIQELNSNAVVTVFPNPAQQKVTINLEKAASANYQVAIFNLSGQQVMTQQIAAQQNSLSFDINSLSVGMYQVVITAGNWTKVVSLVKN